MQIRVIMIMIMKARKVMILMMKGVAGKVEDGEMDRKAPPVGNLMRKRGRNRLIDPYLRPMVLFRIIINIRNVKVNYFQTMVTKYHNIICMSLT